MSNKIVSPAELGDMEHLGEHYGYQLYRNSEGFIEGYKSIGLIDTGAAGGKYSCRPADELIRVVSHATTIDEFKAYITRYEKRAAKYNPYKDAAQAKLPVL
jgi:hypothetical protein